MWILFFFFLLFVVFRRKFRRIYIHKWRRTQKEKKKKTVANQILFCLQCFCFVLFFFSLFAFFLPMHIAVSLVSALCFIACNQDWIDRPVVKTLFGCFFSGCQQWRVVFFYSGPWKTNFLAFPLAGNGVVDSWNVERVSSEKKKKQNALLYSCTSRKSERTETVVKRFVWDVTRIGRHPITLSVSLLVLFCCYTVLVLRIKLDADPIVLLNIRRSLTMIGTDGFQSAGKKLTHTHTPSFISSLHMMMYM